MARYSDRTLDHEVLSTPHSMCGLEVSAEWTRNREGEVIMIVKMPSDTLDLEVYIKTPRGHSGIQMDPWTSATWSRRWNSHYPPNKMTKAKFNKFSQERIYRGISLYKAAGRQQQFRSSYRSPRHNRKQQPLPNGLKAGHPSAKQHKLNKVRHQNNSTMNKSPRKRVREMSPTGSLTDPVLVSSSDYETETTQPIVTQ